MIKNLKFIWHVITNQKEAAFLIKLGTIVIEDAISKYKKDQTNDIEVSIKLNWREVAARKVDNDD